MSAEPSPAELDPARQKLWVAVSAAPWTSLAVVPAVPGVDPSGVGRALAQAGGAYHGRDLELVDARGLPFAGARELVERVAAVEGRHALVVLLDCPAASQSALMVARAASAAILVVPVGDTPLAEARRTLEAVGRASFLGAVTLTRDEP